MAFPDTNVLQTSFLIPFQELLRINYPVMINATFECGLNLEEVKSYLPAELTIWIDPGEVSYRISEKGPVKILHTLFKSFSE
jgi:hypothetical protein